MKRTILLLFVMLFVSCVTASDIYYYRLSGFTENCGCNSEKGYKPVCLSSPMVKLKANSEKTAIKEFKNKICAEGKGLRMTNCACTKPSDDKKADFHLTNCRMEKALLVKKTNIKKPLTVANEANLETLIGMDECNRPIEAAAAK